MVKKITSVVIAILVTVATFQSNAQLQKGYVLIGSDITDLELGLDEGGNFSFTVNPKAAWFFKDNVALGAYLTFGLSTAKDAGTSINYGLGALGRYYFSKSGELLHHSRFFLEGTVGIDGDNPAVGDNTNGLGLGIGPGIAYFLTENIALEGLFKYNGIIGFGSAVTSNNLNLSIGFQIYMPTAKLKKAAQDVPK